MHQTLDALQRPCAVDCVSILVLEASLCLFEGVFASYACGSEPRDDWWVTSYRHVASRCIKYITGNIFTVKQVRASHGAQRIGHLVWFKAVVG